MVSFFHALIFAVVEGVTEFLPISSTGHLILLGRVLHVPSSEFVKSFDIIIQLGAIAAVIVLYARRVLLQISLLKKIIVAFLPTGIIGFIAYPYVKEILGSTQIVIWALFVGGVMIMLFEYYFKTKEENNASDIAALGSITYRQAFFIGIAQSVAIIPGVSRSAATIIGGLWAGLSRRMIVEFSFLLAVPTMLAAAGLDLVKNYEQFSSSQFSVLAVGFVGAFVTALFVIRYLLQYIQKHTFTVFGIYRIILALVWLLLFGSL